MRVKNRPPALDGIVVVLDRPLDVTNVGGVVRAMCNFGLARLRLVEPAAYDEGRILAVAHRGAAVLARLERHECLDAALADCGVVLGTTARSRAVGHERMAPRQAAPALLHAASLDPSTPAAILFGPEDNGLDNAALGRCNAVITIPTTPEASSLNLAQAVLLIAYELWLSATGDAEPSRVPDAAAALAPGTAGFQPVPGTPGTAAILPDPAPRPTGTAGFQPAPAGSDSEGYVPEHGPGESLARGAAREEMFAALEEVLWGMHPNNDAGRVAHTLARLRAVLLRAAPRVEEVRMLTTLFTHIAHERKRD